MQGFYEINSIFVYAFLHLIVLTALDSYLTIPIMYVYGFADCVETISTKQ